MSVDVFIERGAKRVFASAVEWPGWARVARDEEGALAALAAYAPRYARALARKRIAAPVVRSVTDLRVVARVGGNATTDFGAPAGQLTSDASALGPAEMKRLARILAACWAEFDAVAGSARGKTLAKGPRGGGRTLDAIARHCVEADGAYIGGLGGTFTARDVKASERVRSVRRAFEDALAARARGEVPDRGPRGGIRWHPRFAVRRSAWHWLDHAWEIEDRAGTTRP